MLKWCTIYRDDPQREHCTDEHGPPAAVLKRFENAKELGMHDGRKVIGMWLIERPAQEPHDVIDIYGRVPIPIAEAHDGHKRAREKPRQ